MAKAKVVHSDDAATIILKGNKKSPEPSTVIIKFPGGHVEVSRTTDNKYWAHVAVDKASNIKSSRIDYDHKGHGKADVRIPNIPFEKYIQHIAVMIDGPYISTETL